MGIMCFKILKMVQAARVKEASSFSLPLAPQITTLTPQTAFYTLPHIIPYTISSTLPHLHLVPFKCLGLL